MKLFIATVLTAFCNWGVAAVSTNVEITYASGTTNVSFENAGWRAKVEVVQIYSCESTNGKAGSCTLKDSFQVGTKRTVSINGNGGLYRVDFISTSIIPIIRLPLNWVHWSQYVVGDQSQSQEEFSALASKHAPVLSYHEREEYFPVSVKEIFKQSVGNFDNLGADFRPIVENRRINASVYSSATDDAMEFLQKNGHLELRFFLKSEFAKRIQGNNGAAVPTYWTAQKDGDTAWITYFYLYAYDQKRPAYIEDDAGILGVLGNHTVDRESLTIEFNRSSGAWIPQYVIYAGHLEEQETKYQGGSDADKECFKQPAVAGAQWKGGKIAVKWEKASKWGESPIGYVAEGSHAITPARGWYCVDVLFPDNNDVNEPAGSLDTGRLRRSQLNRLEFDGDMSALLFSGYTIDAFSNYRIFPFVRYPVDVWMRNIDKTAFDDCLADGGPCQSIQTPTVSSHEGNLIPGLSSSFTISGRNLRMEGLSLSSNFEEICETGENIVATNEQLAFTCKPHLAAAGQNLFMEFRAPALVGETEGVLLNRIEFPVAAAATIAASHPNPSILDTVTLWIANAWTSAKTTLWELVDGAGTVLAKFTSERSAQETQPFAQAVGPLPAGTVKLTAKVFDENLNRLELTRTIDVASASVNDFGAASGDGTTGNVSNVLTVGVDTTTGTLKLPLGTAAADSTFPYIWIANSGEGTISKLDINTGQELGRYRTGPGNGNPSRTTVDQEGNVWVGNRDNNTLTKVGLKEYGQCIDRNGNGVIDTSTGGNDVRAWTGYFGDGQGRSGAQDECVLLHVVLTYPGVTTPIDVRTIAIDKDNNIYTGGSGRLSVFKINGSTGAVLAAKNTAGSFYGGFVDGNGVLWAVSVYGQQLVQKVMPDLSSELINVGIPVYGIAGDKYGKIWVSSNVVANFVSFEAANPLATIKTHTQTGRTLYSPFAQGIATDGDNVYIAGALSHSVVGHYRQKFVDGAFVGVELVTNYTVGASPTGVAVDGKGRVWATNYHSNSVSRISIGDTVASTVVESFPVGFQPYNYSDMTGRVVRNLTTRQGTWEATFDGLTSDYVWKNVQWTFKNGLPAGTEARVYVKAANSIVEFGAKEYAEVGNGADLGDTYKGRFMKVRVRLTSEDPTKTPEITGLVIQ